MESFLTFWCLEKLKGNYKLMTNLYIPKEDGSKTEIDLIMIAESGIYVFESKNYSGWIFGDEKYKNWTQTLPNKQKNQFYNPIWQNKGHINALKYVVDIDKSNLYKSYIIFSERCTLKKINVSSSNVKVIKRNTLIKSITNDMLSSSNILSIEEVNQIYCELQKFSCVDNSVKREHIESVKMKKI
ncbi:nuclease-like protein [Natranaerovirga pectinivora]|uniref:Nuclease-like protein n=1 Tax=Natranaerovirga pectinivora TaxID=682400 RepID=A0A4R3MH05_9FIRM|nr:nuclease-related domain-containing protein [Natranaerovirga pectinivora]TCT12845.1 nuclease-like protein [Natranaerovirga pectinivora]